MPFPWTGAFCGGGAPDAADPVTLSRRQLLQFALGSGFGAVLPSVMAADTLRLGLISDLNNSYGSVSYIPQVTRGLRQLMALRPELIVCAGDMVAGQKRGLTARELDAMWNCFASDVLQPLSEAGISFLPAIGNHDGAPGFAADRSAVARFWSPLRSALGLNFCDQAHFPFHYSVLQDSVFWIVWDASSHRIPDVQLEWARQQLASSSARQARLRLVVGHLPLFGIGRGKDRYGESLDQLLTIRTLLEEGQVQAYISGHQHVWYPARWGDLDLIQLGALGSGPRRLIAGGGAAQQTFTMLAVNWSQSTLTETTYAVSSGRALDWDAVPSMLTCRSGSLERNDQNRRFRHSGVPFHSLPVL